MSEAEKTRRDTLKLAAAVAAFGAALGFRQTAEGGGKTELKIEHKLYLKLYAAGTPLTVSCAPISEADAQVLRKAGKVEYKVFLNNQQHWDLKTNKAM